MQMPLCVSAPNLHLIGSSTPKIWEGREALKVYFMNPEELDDCNTVLAWARIWNVPFFRDTIPYLAWTEHAEKADIRVMFSSKY